MISYGDTVDDSLIFGNFFFFSSERAQDGRDERGLLAGGLALFFSLATDDDIIRRVGSNEARQVKWIPALATPFLAPRPLLRFSASCVPTHCPVWPSFTFSARCRTPPDLKSEAQLLCRRRPATSMLFYDPTNHAPFPKSPSSSV